MKNKVEFRKYVKQLKHEISADEKAFESEAVFKRLCGLEIFRHSSNILAYASLPDELPTIEFLKKMVNKSIYLPRVHGNDLQIIKYDASDLEVGAFNILEPKGTICINPSEMDLIIVPAVALSRDGYRLGRGRGYYDRLLSKTNALKVGVCLKCQFFDKIPHESFDVRMDYVLTADEFIKIEN